MKVVSLFDGISCAYEALQRAGLPVTSYHASEVDKYAIEVSQRNHPEIIQVGDVKELTIDKLGMGFDDRIDLLIGGSPCQDLSIAKANRKGLDGERSGLFWEYARLVRVLRPRYFILENVASMPEEAKRTITMTLGVAPIMIDAQLVSAQRRKRLFWTNIPNVVLPEDRGIHLRDILEHEVDEKYYVKEETLKKIQEKLMAGKPLGQALRIHGIDGKSVTLSALGGGTGAKTGLYVINPNGSEQTKSKTLRTSGHGSGFGDKHNWDQIAVLTRPRGKNNGTLDTEKSPTLTSSFPHNSHLIELLQSGHVKVRRLTPTECERLQSLPDGHTAGATDNQRYKMLGNAFNVDVITHILGFIPKSQCVCTAACGAGLGHNKPI